MSRETRVNAGLGDPPLPYFNNMPESANAMIKRAVNFNESEMSKFCNEMSTLLLCQKENVDSAVINKGPYRLASKFRPFEVQQSAWFKMNANQRDKHLRKFHDAQISETTNDNRYCSSVIPESPSSTIERVSVSTDLVESGIQSAPAEILHSISHKAEELLNKNGSILQAPGSVDGMAYVVESYTSVRPHYVSIAKNGKVTCQDCPNWKALKICAHAVAAAEKCGMIAKYIEWILNKGPAQINMTALMTSDSSSGTGKKGGKGSTARRKGGRTAKRTPVSSVVDRPLFMQTSETPQRESARQAVCTSRPASATLPASYQMTSAQQPVCTPPPTTATPQGSQQVPLPTPVNPPVGTFVVSLLQCCPPLVCSCFGCSQSLKPGGNVASPPYDLTIVTRMNRGFRPPNTPDGQLMYKEQNVYFQLHLGCLKLKQPHQPRVA
jgi:hypothetical protein